jgi:hypothetical protein
MDAESGPHGPIDITDILALVVLVLASMRRFSVRVAEAESYPHLPVATFDAWRNGAMAAYGLAVQASFLKFSLNTVWYYGGRHWVPTPVLAMGGAILFVAWAVALTVAWRRSTTSRLQQAALGIVLRSRGEPAHDRRSE